MLKTDHELVLTLEDGIVEGGFGQTIASFYGLSDMKVKNYGIKKSFPTDFRPEELMREWIIRRANNRGYKIRMQRARYVRTLTICGISKRMKIQNKRDIMKKNLGATLALYPA